ncbi:GNAT family N-acetyltransferase [Streptomyces sp. NPDC004561]
MIAVCRPKPVIDCEDFVLRRWRPQEDFQTLFQLIEESLHHLLPWMPWVAGHSQQATSDFLDRCDPDWRTGQAYHYAISDEGKLVGNCSLFRIADTRGREMGYWLHPAATGRGLATRAAAAMTKEAFALPGVEYVQIVHDLANTASETVPRRLGFTQVGYKPGEQPLASSESGTDAVWQLYATGP